MLFLVFTSIYRVSSQQDLQPRVLVILPLSQAATRVGGDLEGNARIYWRALMRLDNFPLRWYQEHTMGLKAQAFLKI